MPIRNSKKETYAIATSHHSGLQDTSALKDLIVKSLDDDKALDIEVIDLTGQSALADYMVIASGTSSRQIVAMSEKLHDRLAMRGHHHFRTEGATEGNWIVCDTGDIIVHLFRPEVRAFYNIEEMWRMMPTPMQKSTSAPIGA